MTRKLFYRIFCKYCERPFNDNMNCFEIHEEDMVFGGFRLNCHWCNNYAIFISPDDNEVRESCRGVGRGRHYFDGKSKELMESPPKWQFEMRESR